jgi:hypothetical protein
MALNGYYNVKFICHKLKTSTPSFPWDDASDAELTALFAALNGISVATLEKAFITQLIAKDVGSTAVPPTTASRGKKYVLKYRDTVTLNPHQIEVPGGDDTLLTTGTDMLALASGPGLALKTAFDIAVVSPAGNVVELQEVEFDTRNIE